MTDWNHDGKDDYWDDVYYMENIDRSYRDDEIKDGNDDDDDDILTTDEHYPRNKRYSSNTPVRSSRGMPPILKLIIMITIVSIIGAFNELLAVIILFIWAYIELLG